MPAFAIDTVIKISGFRELDKAFATLPNAVSKRVLRGAIKKSLKPVEQDAQQNASESVRTGGLLRSIGISTKLAPTQAADSPLPPGHVRMIVGTESKRGAHAHLIEFGTAHSAAQSFMRPAWDANKRGVMNTIAAEAWKSLQRMARRLHKQALAGKLSKVGKRTLFG